MSSVINDKYKAAEAYLNEIPKFTSKNPIEETEGFYDFLQTADGGKYNEKKLGKLIHVAGTNGKGSVCAFLQSICIESGYKTAMFISPHLVTTRERFAVDGKIASKEEFLEAYEWLNGKIEEYHKIKNNYNPTYFERLFFMGLYFFSKAEPEVTILETGLGGRLDTTNVIKHPSATVITEIGFDHMAYLGDTLEKIAGEKAGIIKKNVPVIFSDRKKEVYDVLKDKSEEKCSKYYPVSKKDYKIKEIKKKSIDFYVTNLYDYYVSLKVNTTALYQVENAAIAYRTCEVLRNECGFDRLCGENVSSGIEKMHWVGRMDEIKPDIYIDGAHNEDGIEAFVQSVESMQPAYGNGKCVIVFSVVKDKEYDKMIRMLCGLDFVSDFVITHIPGARGADLEELSGLFRKYCKSKTDIHTYENIEDAVKYSIGIKGEGGRVYIAGSLYLAGIVEDIFRRQV